MLEHNAPARLKIAFPRGDRAGHRLPDAKRYLPDVLCRK
jgi:hypothetical protein